MKNENFSILSALPESPVAKDPFIKGFILRTMYCGQDGECYEVDQEAKDEGIFLSIYAVYANGSRMWVADFPTSLEEEARNLCCLLESVHAQAKKEPVNVLVFHRGHVPWIASESTAVNVVVCNDTFNSEGEGAEPRYKIMEPDMVMCKRIATTRKVREDVLNSVINHLK